MTGINETLRAIVEHNLPIIPDGYAIIDPEGIIQPGEMWSYFGATGWFPSQFVGHERSANNVYIRKLA